MKNLEFIVGSLKNFKWSGTVFPCSSASAKKMTKPVDFKNAKIIVELGGGAGAITKEILKRMRPETKLIVFEINPEFAEFLREFKDKRMTVITDSAEHLEKHLKKMGIEQVDAVISTLPLVIFDKALRNRILDTVTRVVKPSGMFVQISYSFLTRKEMRERFKKSMRIDFTPFNIPPAVFYIMTFDPKTGDPNVDSWTSNA